MSAEYERGWEFADEEESARGEAKQEGVERSEAEPEEGWPEEPEEEPLPAWDDESGPAEEDIGPDEDEAWDEPLSLSSSTPPLAGQDRKPAVDQQGDVPRPPQRPTAGRPRQTLGWDGLRKARGLVKPDEVRLAFSPHERLLILDTWQRSGLPAGDFAPLVGISKHTLYLWKKRFAQHGPAGLMEQPRGAATGSKLSEVTKRTIVMLKQLHPDWGCQRISDELLRGPALAASAAAVARVLHDAGYEVEQRATRPHRDKTRRFERARPNQLWQTDLFTFILKRQNRRLYLVAFMDDHSRFIVGFGLHASASSALVLEVLRAAIASYVPPEEILTDNGSQYVTWRGKSQFTRELEQQGIRQVVSRPQHPQTLGKIERFWGTLWRECLQRAVFLDLEDARRRIGLFIDYYNFRRPHQGLEGLTPADRFFSAAPAVLQTLKERVAVNALELARQGMPRPPFYMTGQVAGQSFSVHAEGERVIFTRPGQPRQEVELVAPPAEAVAETKPTTASDSLPPSLCPHAAPASADTLQELPPGMTWYESAPPLAGVEQPTPINTAESTPPAEPMTRGDA